MTNTLWREWMELLGHAQAGHAACDLFRIIQFVIGLPAWTCCQCFPCASIDPFQRSMKKWLRDFNVVLEPLGMYVKVLTFAETAGGGGHWKDGSTAVLMIAYTDEQIHRLQSEPILQRGHSGDPQWACWCCAAHAGRVV